KLRVGAFNGGMSEVMMQPMADYVVAKGGEIRTNSPVEALLVEDDSVRGVVVRGRKIKGEHVILAASLRSAQRLISKSLKHHEWFADMLKLPTMPAVTFQMELTKPSMELDRTTFGPQTALASFAEQSRTTFRGSAGRLSVILATPDTYIAMPPADILDIVVRDARRLGIELEDIVKDYRKIIWQHDFYSLEPNHEYLRPSQRTPIPGLTLAGDYTKQPYLATMEGATVSGKIASSIVLGQQ
ncbi:MAG TPA: FAD-dependent oxidoreductase, partial [Candidatus Saccharimonadales bacterium]|nr:FAD-dependent oxidoreductase [Candidatus Saccharimonadales bacterium]